MTNNTFGGKRFKPGEVASFISRGNWFVLTLAGDELLKIEAENGDVFRAWLAGNGVKDISEEVGSLIMDHYFKGVPPLK